MIKFLGGGLQPNSYPLGAPLIPSIFNHVIDKIFHEMIYFTASYSDDITIVSHTIDEHFKHVNIVLAALYDVGLKLN